MLLVPLRMVGLFLVQLFVCETPFLFGFKPRKNFPVRALAAVSCFLLSVVGITWLRLLCPRNPGYVLSNLLGIAYFVAIIILNALAVWRVCDTSLRGALFAVASGYSIEHIASRLSYLVQAWVYHGGEMPPFEEFFVFDFAIPVVISLTFYFTLILKGIVRKTMPFNDSKVLAVSIVNLFICIVVSSFEQVRGGETVPELMSLSVHYLCAILGCTLCLLLQVGYFKESELDEKNRLLFQMLRMEREKYRLSQETIDIINRKCHDLRHQVRMLEQQTPEERSKSLRSITDAIHIYDSLPSTGNRSIDLVLMEKKLLCDKYNINFTYLVDGSKFSFMDEADIYAMLGNMLENAMECVEQEPDAERRIITFQARARGDMLYISMENYCALQVSFEDGIPTTSKDDKAFHGFGVQSILHIAESYGGNARFFLENQYFIVEVLIPIPSQA